MVVLNVLWLVLHPAFRGVVDQVMIMSTLHRIHTVIKVGA